jgi:hypothetical protein
VNPQISANTFNSFFAWAPLIIGLVIYAVFFVAKRHEAANGPSPIGQSFACASCGRRGHREHMVPREHDGAVSWYCGRCAAQMAVTR